MPVPLRLQETGSIGSGSQRPSLPATLMQGMLGKARTKKNPLTPTPLGSSIRKSILKYWIILLRGAESRVEVSACETRRLHIGWTDFDWSGLWVRHSTTLGVMLSLSGSLAVSSKSRFERLLLDWNRILCSRNICDSCWLHLAVPTISSRIGRRIGNRQES
jgi:hypothetical protein